MSEIQEKEINLSPSDELERELKRKKKGLDKIFFHHPHWDSLTGNDED